MRAALVWIAATTVAYAVGVTVAAYLMGAFGHAASGLFSGMVFVALFGALVGLCVAPIQLAAMRAGSVRRPEWVAFTIGGATLGLFVGAPVGETLGDAISPTGNIIVGGGAIEMITAAVIGAFIGGAQQLALRRTNTRTWAAATAIGMALGWGAAGLILEIVEIDVLRAAIIPSFGAIVGLLVGTAQVLAVPRSSIGTSTPAA